MNTRLISSLTFALSIVLCTANDVAAAGADTVATDNKKIRMKPAWVKQIRNVQRHGVQVFYPEFMPSRYSLGEMKFGGYDKTHPDYSLIFKAKGKHSITIESAYEGIGDGPDGYKKLKGRSKWFGPFTIDVFKPHTEGNDTNDFYFLSNWLESRKKSTADAKRFYNLYGTGVTNKEAVAIIESLTPLRKESRLARSK